jgi:hypothetical protein
LTEAEAAEAEAEPDDIADLPNDDEAALQAELAKIAGDDAPIADTTAEPSAEG